MTSEASTPPPVQYPAEGTGSHAFPDLPPESRRTSHPFRIAVVAATVGLMVGGAAMWLALRHREPVSGSLAASSPTLTQPSRTPLFYRSPMNPRQTSPVPTKDEMGMEYLPVFDGPTPIDSASVEGLATVSIDPARQQLIGLRAGPVTRGEVGGSWRTVGQIQVDQTRVRKINSKVEGYVERIFVDFVGRPVRKGDPLFSIYSPNLFAAQNEYLLARDTQKALSKGGALSSSGDALVASARRKLELWDVPPEQIERLERTGIPSKTLTFVSPISGVVTAKNVVEGARLGPGDFPYEITDLGVVWAMADAYQSDLGRVRVGMGATLTTPAYPDRIFEGRVQFIEPLLDPKTRTAKLHIHFPNPAGELKPEMFVEVTLQGASREGLLIPLDAVVHSGTRDVVFLALGSGKFQPIEVKLGEKSGPKVEVTAGLEEGQQVVTGANFLVDSESQLRASLNALGGH